MEENLKGKTAIITGASRGIGKAIACSVASLGINVSIAARQEAPLKATADEIAKKYKVKTLSVACDVTNLSDLENLVKKTKEKFGNIDILINNAGVSSQSAFHLQPLEDFEKLAHTNYLGYVRLIRLVINDMINNKSGAIINMVSGSTLCDPLPRNFLVYSSLKVGLRAFSKGLFWEMRDHGTQPSGDAGFAGVDFLTTAHQTNNDRPILMAVHVGN